LGLVRSDSGDCRFPATLYFCHWCTPQGTAVKAYANAALSRASNASGLLLFRQPVNAKPNALLSNRKIQVVEALQDTGR
ncbi:MAG: hypothetical protein ACJ79F_06360, partial [Gemmatimonadaceae bacterium]